MGSTREVWETLQAMRQYARERVGCNTKSNNDGGMFWSRILLMRREDNAVDGFEARMLGRQEIQSGH